jgi:hypothetical protein
LQVLRSRTCFRRCRVRRVPFSRFALPDSFSTISKASGAVLMFCAPGHDFGGAGGVEYRFHVLRSRTRFRRYRGRRVPFSCFARPDSFSAVPRASGLVFKFFAPGLLFIGTEGVRSYSCFALSDSFFAVPMASGPVFKICAPGLVFGGAECVGSHFHVFHARTHFRRYRGRRVPFSSFARPD